MHGDSCCNPTSKQGAYMQIICSVADKVASHTMPSYAQEYF